MKTYHLRYQVVIDDSESVDAESFSDAMYKLTEQVKKSYSRNAEIKIEAIELEADAGKDGE